MLWTRRALNLWLLPKPRGTFWPRDASPVEVVKIGLIAAHSKL